MTERRFAPSGLLALDEKAFGLMLLMPYTPVTVDRDGVTVLSIRGPLAQFRDVFCDSYEDICARVDAALASSPRALVLSIASPGGVVAGCFEAAEHVRTACKARGVPLISYVDGYACSAAYALACVADRVVAPPTATVGHIGVIAETRDTLAQDVMQGVRVELIKSGRQKADGNPHQSVAPAYAALEQKVLAMASQFFEHVAKCRPLAVDAVRALEAATFIGAAAQSQGLTDETATLDQLIASITNPKMTAAPAAEETEAMSKAEDDKKKDDMFSQLRKMADSGDEQAKKMLKAAYGDDPPKSEDKPADKPAADAPPAKPEDKPKDDDESKAIAAASKDSADAKSIAMAAHRAVLIAGRPDITPELKAQLEKLEPDVVKGILDATPKRALKGTAAASAVVKPTLAAGQTDDAQVSAEDAAIGADLDTRMGLADRKVNFHMEGTKHVMPVYGRQAARNEIAKRAAIAAAKAKAEAEAEIARGAAVG